MAFELIDLAPSAQGMLDDVCKGLMQEQKSLPCQYFYDAEGARLFEDICELDAYYLTRTELAILRRAVNDMAAAIGSEVAVIEPGSGSGIKTRLLLEALDTPNAYMPIDVAREQLLDYAGELASRYPQLSLCPVCGDFTQDFPLPGAVTASAGSVLYFPGSTIGNFPRQEAQALLQRWRDILGDGAQLLIGVDLQKDPALLHAAYDDEQGLTARFNRNVLHHINRRLDADFAPEHFAHQISYDDGDGTLCMWLVSQRQQQVRINDSVAVEFAADEPILTEYCCKYTRDGFARLAGEAGWAVDQVWTDQRDWFSVQLLRAA